MSMSITWAGLMVQCTQQYCPLNGVKDGPYLVMNDLEVKPLSTISVVTLLNKFHLKEDGDLEEKVVDLGMAKVF